jgi:hypothetical protein
MVIKITIATVGLLLLWILLNGVISEIKQARNMPTECKKMREEVQIQFWTSFCKEHCCLFLLPYVLRLRTVFRRMVSRHEGE